MDYAALATSLTTQLTAALTAVVGIVTLILGAKAGIRFFKSFAK